jgi:hypothetical protein
MRIVHSTCNTNPGSFIFAVVAVLITDMRLAILKPGFVVLTHSLLISLISKEHSTVCYSGS